MRTLVLGSLQRALVVFALAACATLGIACGSDAKKGLGLGCELNSECDAPLVCRIGLCRKECATSRDCTTGLACVRDVNGLGACQVVEELMCSMTSQCQSPLVCIAPQCVNECRTERDCPAGARCQGGGCIEQTMQACARDSECAGGLVCIAERCRIQCLTDRDCRFGTVCRGMPAGRCQDPLFDGGPTLPDAGADSGSADGGGGGFDGGGFDGGGSTDAGGGGPCEVSGILASQVAAGEDYACAVLRDGRIACWGYNEFGQLGDDRRRTSFETRPVLVRGIADARFVALGTGLGCAVVGAAGDVHCWGNFGVPFGGTSTTEYDPVPWFGVTGAVRLELDGNGSAVCAVLSSGGVTCTGDNSFGGLASGPDAFFSTPTIIPVTNASVVALGANCGCAALNTAALQCWGRNDYGEVGDGTMTTARSPVTNPTVPFVVDVRGRHKTFCAQTTANELWCWGWSRNGEVGTGMAVPAIPTPARVTLPMMLQAFEVGSTHACAVAGGHVYCWGFNGQAELGQPTTTMRSTVPVEVPTITNAMQVTVGGRFSCALLVTGEIYCWGSNVYGALGDGTGRDFVGFPLPPDLAVSTPVRVDCIP